MQTDRDIDDTPSFLVVRLNFIVHIPQKFEIETKKAETRLTSIPF